MKVLHSSDLHGNYKKLLEALSEKFDLWIDTGDFFDNISWGNPYLEAPYQLSVLRARAKEINDALEDRPLIYVPGNHDYVELSVAISNAFRVEPDSSISKLDHVFSGFREVGRTGVPWNGELRDEFFPLLMDMTFSHDPTILITHNPATGVLDQDVHGDSYGIDGLRERIEASRVRHHFFGHIHNSGNCEREGVKYFNGACRVLFHEV